VAQDRLGEERQHKETCLHQLVEPQADELQTQRSAETGSKHAHSVREVGPGQKWHH